MPSDVHQDLFDLADMWEHLEDAATTRTSVGIHHPVPLSFGAPLRIAILVLTRDILDAVTPAARILGVLDSESVDAISPYDVAATLHLMAQRSLEKAEEPGWQVLELVLRDLIEGVANDGRRLLGYEEPVTNCPVCGKPVTADGDVLTCPECGPRTAPVYVTCTQAAELIGVPTATVRKACQRHLTPLAGTRPAQYRLDQIQALFPSK